MPAPSYAGNGDPTGSYYAASANPAPLRPMLQGLHETEICVLGAGFSQPAHQVISNAHGYSQ